MTQNEKSKIRAKVIKWVTRLFLILVAIIMLYPLAWNVVSSFKTSTEFLTDPFAWPQGLAWDNYVRAYEKSNLAANIGNSIYVVLETLVIIVVCVVPCSYCLVRYKFPGAKLILNIYMAAIFIQATYIMIPLFLQMNKLNLLNSLTALGVLYATMQFPFAIFLLTGFLRGELGMRGMIITDYSGSSKYMDLADGLIAGSDIWDSPDPTIHTTLAPKYENDAYIVTEMRESMHKILYTVANSNAMNGWSSADRLKVITPWWKTALYALDIVLAVLTVLCIWRLVVAIKRKKTWTAEQAANTASAQNQQ